ncbi:MAG: hypothetical protein K0R10_1096 [Alphaproteobacteria bacterium]|jgi:polyisoprenoid-binding protein YceI|nr:hypothetical protein [Alphaproteobacteria bacterium]
MITRAVLGFIALLLAATPALAAPDKYSFDPAHTQILFSVSHLGFSHSHGRFNKLDGSFTFDEKNPAASTIDVTIDTSSVDMGSNEWDDAVTADALLNAKKFPKMTFKSTGVTKTGDKTGSVTGDLTLLGVTKPVTLNVTYNKSGNHPYTKNHLAGFSASATLKRSEFGMVKYLPDVGDDVTITIEVEGIRQDFEGMNAK